ncbi:hypothetical protein F383_38653 [Gossypium arboreum]|uniref:Uncharacterized protein n=1 Tax=Gossypium arboreum TaxID=29729 RepID=A0A0B0MHH4_GOSAR|nr:hypothetical protein F383_38653 [Gossypium arboreum]
MDTALGHTRVRKSRPC